MFMVSHSFEGNHDRYNGPNEVYLEPTIRGVH